MNAISILYGGNLNEWAYKPLFNGKNSAELAKEQAGKFPGASKVVLIEESLTKRRLLNRIAELQEGFDFAYFAFADCPFLDPALAGSLADRHTRFKAEYSYADGYPHGVAPELLSPGTAAILAKILGDEDGEAESGMLFSVIQKDINAFDIETEISEIDHRCRRLNLISDSKRNLLLLNNFLDISKRLPALDAGGGSIPSASDIEKIIENNPEILRTLPAFYPIQVYGGCPRECGFCPYPLITNSKERKDFMSVSDFEILLEKISAFSVDAVIDLSLWGELSLHPQNFELVKSVTNRKNLSCVIETSGIGWNINELEKFKDLKKLSWIVSVESSESESVAKKLFEYFPNDTFVQIIRTKGSEDETEKFFRYWKSLAPCGEKNIIVQKYDDFCGFLDKKQASDISPVIRKPCWHIMRDMPILIDGTVPLCRSDLKNGTVLGNAFNNPLETVWSNGKKYYSEHCNKKYPDICLRCDEYYTYNF